MTNYKSKVKSIAFRVAQGLSLGPLFLHMIYQIQPAVFQDS